MAKARSETRLSKLIVAASYPAIMALGFGLFAVLGATDLSVTLAAYISVLCCAGLITLHELKLPYRGKWNPEGGEVTDDALFMVTVQIALPYLLGISLVLALADVIATTGIALERFWPHGAPVALQVCLMLLAADFPRYWLHRAFHKFTPMWRFHAVHHSPHRLYWLNVGRFHPLEKALQYSVDALPFLLLGVSPEVIAAYLVFYAINGFYQHSNCRVHLGPLNYIVSGPELHRWHHSKFVKESDSNFGNNLIVWDLIFGTRFLPRDRDVGPLGLLNRHYPKGFLAQMKTPFIRDLDKG